MIYIPILYIILIILLIFILQTIVVILVIRKYVKRAKSSIIVSLDSIYTMLNSHIDDENNRGLVDEEHFLNIKDKLMIIRDSQITYKTAVDSIVVGTEKHNKQTAVFISNFNKLHKDDLANLRKKRRSNTTSVNKPIV